MENLKNKKVVETFSDDMVKAIASDKSGSIVKKIIEEEEQHEAVKKNLSPTSKKNRLFMLLGAILITFGLSILIFFAFSSFDNTVPISKEMSQFIFTDQTEFRKIDGLNREKMASLIWNHAVNVKIKSGGISGLYLTLNKKVVSFEKFLSLLGANLSEKEVSIFKSEFLIGSLGTGQDDSSKNAHLFILLKTFSFNDAFTAMSGWEKKFFNDFHGLIGMDINPETKYLLSKDFEDVFVSNKNARALKDKEGNIVLMYVFVDDNSLIITNSEEATEEIVMRLNSTKIKK